MKRFLVLVALIVVLIVTLAVAVYAATSKTPVTDAINQATSWLFAISLLANIVLTFSRGKVKAAAQAVVDTTQHIQSQLAGIDPTIYGICDKFFSGPEGRQMGAKAGLDYLVKTHPEWQLAATQVSALIDHFGPMLAKIGK